MKIAGRALIATLLAVSLGAGVVACGSTNEPIWDSGSDSGRRTIGRAVQRTVRITLTESEAVRVSHATHRRRH